MILGVFAFIVSSNAQDISKHALGLRLGDDNGFGVEVSYQLGLVKNKRLELDLGWRDQNSNDAIKLTGSHHWVYEIEERFNWFIGPAGGIYHATYDAENNQTESETSIFVGGMFGVEYNFDFPLLLSIDIRPELGLGDNNNDLGLDLALGVRYQF